MTASAPTSSAETTTRADRVLARLGLPVTVAVVAATGLLLVGGFLFKAPCLDPWTGQQFSTGCYNDIQYLYPLRAIDDNVFPYVHGALDGDTPVNGALEYPVLTGLFTWFSGLPASDENAFLIWSAVLLAPFGLVTALLLARMTGSRALLFALAPPLVLYAFHNWDLLVVAATVGGIYAWWRGHYAWAAFWLGIGACLKLYPAFFLAPLFLDRLAAGDRREAWRTAATGVFTIGAINLPFALINADGWWATYAFQRLREADFTSNSIWVWGFPELSRGDLNVLTPVLIAVAFAVALGVGWWRANREGVYPFVQVCGAMLMAFVLLNKVFSPQYALWLLPFLVLVRVRWGWWVAFVVIDLVLYFGLFRWFFDTVYQGFDFGLAKQATIVGIWGRAALVALLFAVFLGAANALRRRVPVSERSAA